MGLVYSLARTGIVAGLLMAALVAAVLILPPAYAEGLQRKGKSTAPVAGSAVAGNIAVAGAWARKPLTANGNSAAFLVLNNHGKTDNRLLSVRSADMRKVELHTHIKDGDIMKMRRIEGGIALPAGTRVELRPGGDHIMLIGPRRKLAEGDRLILTLVFAHGPELVLDLPVRRPPTRPSHRGSHMAH